MGGLFSTLGGKIAYLFQKKGIEGRLLILGLDAGGKTTILYRMKMGDDAPIITIPTIGFNVESVDCGGVKLTSWDVGGEDKIRPLWRHYYQGTDAVLFVVDSNDRERMPEAWDELKRFSCEEELKDARILICMNKQDLPNAMKASEFVNRFNVAKHFEVLRNDKWFIYEMAAVQNEGVAKPFEDLALLLTGKTVLNPYTCPGFGEVNDLIYSKIGWNTKTHVLYPQKFKEMILTLFLISEKKQRIPMEMMWLICSYLNPLDFFPNSEKEKDCLLNEKKKIGKFYLDHKNERRFTEEIERYNKFMMKKTKKEQNK